MSDDAVLKLFLGEREERFQITPVLIPELERVCGVGIGMIFKRLTDGHYHFAEITQTIRLGLIGGGMSPKDAARFCATYVEGRPFIESYPVALSILERLWYGAPVVQALIAEISKGDDDAA